MIRKEVLDLFAANSAAMAQGDKPHLDAQILPSGVTRVKDLPYIHDNTAEHLLDIYTPEHVNNQSDRAALPVIIDFHGGGLYYGTKENNECRDMYLAKEGFAVVNANYRLVPEVSFLDQLADATAVFSWVAQHSAEYHFDLNAVFATGDSAGAALALYAVAANNTPLLAIRWGLTSAKLNIAGLIATSGMFRLSGGVHATALSYYCEGYLQTPQHHIAMDAYLDLDLLVNEAQLPPIYMVTSVEDFIADNTYELARILHKHHCNFELKSWSLGTDRPLGHVFSIVQAGNPEAVESHDAIQDIANYCRSILATR